MTNGYLLATQSGSISLLHSDPRAREFPRSGQLFVYDVRLRSYRVSKLPNFQILRYDSVYLTCSKKLTDSQLSPPHGTNKKLKCETKNKTMSMIGPVRSSPVVMKAVR